MVRHERQNDGVHPTGPLIRRAPGAPPGAVDLIAGPGVWLESEALDQLRGLAALPGFVRAVGLPDLHPGAGTPIGAVVATAGQPHPTLVGTDAGCGVLLWPTRVRRFHPDRLESRARDWAESLTASDDEELWDAGTPLDAELREAARSLGTLGGGNHFAELARVATVEDRPAAEALGLAPGTLVVLVHSGSRRVGRVLGLRWAREAAAGETWTAPDAEARLLGELDLARRFARESRARLAEGLLAVAGAAGPNRHGDPVDTVHNDVTVEPVDGEPCWVHRKGASHAPPGAPGVVLGTRGSPSFVVLGQGSLRALGSMAHGAGRRMRRSEAVAKLRARHTRREARRSAGGGRLVCARPEQLWEEHPEAYKAIGPVMESLVAAGVAAPVARLEPVITVKT